jgi:hypothetical protein
MNIISGVLVDSGLVPRAADVDDESEQERSEEVHHTKTDPLEFVELRLVRHFVKHVLFLSANLNPFVKHFNNYNFTCNSSDRCRNPLTLPPAQHKT